MNRSQAARQDINSQLEDSAKTLDELLQEDADDEFTPIPESLYFQICDALNRISSHDDFLALLAHYEVSYLAWDYSCHFYASEHSWLDDD